VPFAEMAQATSEFLKRRGARYVEGEDARLQHGGYAIWPSLMIGNMWHGVFLLG